MTRPKDSAPSAPRAPRRQPAPRPVSEAAETPARRPSRLEDSLRRELMEMGMTAEKAEAWIRRI